MATLKWRCFRCKTRNVAFWYLKRVLFQPKNIVNWPWQHFLEKSLAIFVRAQHFNAGASCYTNDSFWFLKSFKKFSTYNEFLVQSMLVQFWHKKCKFSQWKSKIHDTTWQVNHNRVTCSQHVAITNIRCEPTEFVDLDCVKCIVLLHFLFWFLKSVKKFSTNNKISV
jgi:hypothetical protein